MSDYLIDQQADLNGIVQEISDVVGIDTEFYIRRTFFRIPCLLQIATQQNCYIVDLAAPLNLQPIETLIQNSAVQKVLHSASEDLKIIQYLFGDIPNNVVDTQLAHAFLSPEDQRSYHGVVEEHLSVALNQSSAITTSNWSNRPLSSQQIEYAIDDVQYLLPLRKKLFDRLGDLGRLEWFREEMSLYLESQIEGWKFNLSSIQGFRKLTTHERGLVTVLAEWRESLAKRTNVPRRWVATDEQLVWTVQHRKESIAQFRKELGKRLGGRLHKVIRKVLRYKRTSTQEPARLDIESSRFRRKSPLINTMKEIVKAKSELLQMSRNLLGNQGNLIEWANYYSQWRTSPPNFGAWREQVLGSEFRDAFVQTRS